MKSNEKRQKAYVITGPTSGAGKATALAMAGRGVLVLVGRNRAKLSAVQREIEQRGGQARAVLCDLADLASVRTAAEEILALQLPLVGLLNNAGVQNPRSARTKNGWDMTYVANHLGPFALTDALLPHLEDGANVLFVSSATEDPGRRPAVRAGFRGGRYLSAAASLQGEWIPDGSVKPGMDAYATSKQCNLATALELARENPRLYVNAIEPGIMFNTGLHGELKPWVRVLAKCLTPLLAPFVKVLSTPQRAARVMTRILTDSSAASGVYYDESGHPMQGSATVRDAAFQKRVVEETRALLASPELVMS